MAAQDAGIGTTLPMGQRKPASHSTHAVAPLSPWYEPSAHGPHCWLVLPAANVPALHAVGAVEPAKQYEPSPHASHPSALGWPTWLLKRPASHGAALPLMLPASQKYPASHAPEHAASLSPVVSPYRPAGHALASDEPAGQ